MSSPNLDGSSRAEKWEAFMALTGVAVTDDVPEKAQQHFSPRKAKCGKAQNKELGCGRNVTCRRPESRFRKSTDRNDTQDS